MESGHGNESLLFEDVTAIHTLHLAPVHLGDIRSGVKQHLNRLLLRYSPKLAGIPLCYSKMELVTSDSHGADATNNNNNAVAATTIVSAPIYYENPCVHIKVKLIWTLFCPQVGAQLSGIINAISRDHVGLLVFGYFSAIISSTQMEAVYYWDDDDFEWKDRSTRQSLNIEDRVIFEIIEILSDGPILTIVGSFDRLLLSPSSTSNNAEGGILSPKGHSKRKHLSK